MIVVAQGKLHQFRIRNFIVSIIGAISSIMVGSIGFISVGGISVGGYVF